MFTSDNVIQHELGKGETDFKWHRRSKQQSTSYIHTPSSSAISAIENAKPLCETDTTRTSDSGDDPSDTAASLVPHASAEQATMRATIAGVVSRELMVKSKFVDCSSVFVEPMEWIGRSLLGSNEGKVREGLLLLHFGILTILFFFAATVSKVWITTRVFQLVR